MGDRKDELLEAIDRLRDYRCVDRVNFLAHIESIRRRVLALVDEPATEDVVHIFRFWAEKVPGRANAKLTTDRRRKVAARLRDGYTVEFICQAIRGAASHAFVNDVGVRFDDLELICRNGSKLENFAARASTINGFDRRLLK